MNMFVGEMCCIFAYWWIRRKQRQQYGTELTPDEKEAVSKGLILNYSPLWFAIPACFDVLSSTLMYVGLNSVNASVMQIINCTILVWIALLSVVYLKRKYNYTQTTGLIALFIGVCIVSVGAIMNSSSNGSGETKPFGVICLVVSVVFAAMLMIAEEKILSVYYAHPLQMVGAEGTTGLAIYAVLLPIFYFIPCTPDALTAFCPYGIFEDTPRAFNEISRSLVLFIAVIITITSLGSFNFFGVSLTKCASATHRGAVNAVRPFTVWIFCLIVQWETFSWIQLAGYIVSVYGMVLYYGILPLNPVSLFNKPPETEETKKMIT